MKQIRVGIVGFGNLGKAVLEFFSNNPKIKVVAVFSKHLNKSFIFGVPVFRPEQSLRFKNKIDIMVLCTGSQNDMLKDAPLFAQHFNIINSFDTHKRIKQQLNIINDICKENKTFAIISCGWDPGVFSIFKAYFSLFCEHFAVFYGKGISLGHTNAVKKINGVKDAISFTLPNRNKLKEAKMGCVLPANLLNRNVFVVANKNRQIIKSKILNIKNYFKGENTKISFVSQEKLNSLKTLAHKGEIFAFSNIASNEMYNLKFKTSSNPMATAKILLAFSLNMLKLKEKYGAGAFTPLDFSPKDLLLNKNSIFKGII